MTNKMELADRFKDLKENTNYNKQINGIIKKNQRIKWNFTAVSRISKIKYLLGGLN